MKKRIGSLLMTLVMCLSLGTFILPQEARAESYRTFDTSKTYFIWLKEDNGAMNYRWNADGTGKKDVIHLDVPSGGNCVMTFTAAEEDGYYGIRCKDRYINTKDNNEKPGQYLHQWEDFYEGDNQKFMFLPVEGEDDTYYIQMKKGSLYVGLQDNKAEQHSIIETADNDHKCKWVVVPTDRAPFPTDKTQTFDTSKEYYLWLKEGDTSTYDYRWNADGTLKGNVIHLDIPAGGNCKFTLKDAGGGYYGIKCTESRLYVDTDENDNQLQRVLHQYHDDLDQDNQKFRFIPVEGEDNTYYIQIKNSGMYVGLNGFNSPERNRTLVTADADHACKWEVVSVDTTQLEPNAQLPGAKDHVGWPEDGALTFMMNPVGYQSGLSVNNDAKWNGDAVHLWTMGHFCKVTAEYIGTDRDGVNRDAYRIRSFDYFETTTYTKITPITSVSFNFVWDVDDQSKSDGATIHVWEQEGDNKASTLWRFIAVPDQEDVYYIQNVNSHLYIGPETEEDKDGVKLKQTSKKVPWEIHWLYASAETKEGVPSGSVTYHGYSVDENGKVTDPSDRINAGNWMRWLPDEIPLSQINIPGTHDAAATRFYTSDSNVINEDWAQLLAQMLYVDEQLNAGVRAWDLRISNKDSNVTVDPTIIHGEDFAICHDRWGNELHLSAVMKAAWDFLDKHPQETVVIKLMGQGNGNSLDVAQALFEYIMTEMDLSKAQKDAIAAGTMTYDDIGPRYPIYVPSKEDLNTRAPTLGDVRGKIVFLNGLGVPDSFASDLEEYQYRALGPDISPWVNSSTDQEPSQGFQKIEGTCAWAQDVYDLEDGNRKMEYVDAVFADLSRNHQTDSAYVLNFASAHDDISVSKTIYKRLMADSTLDQTSGARKNTGILFCNEIDPLLTRRIYMSNFDANGSYLPFASVSRSDPAGISETFTDVSKDAWYHDAVQWAVDKGVMKGVSADKFSPNGSTTRAMVVTMLWRIAGEPGDAAASGFTDVKDGSWYEKAVNWAAENGVVAGTSKTTFSPGASVTREQLAAILYRYAQSKGQGFTGAWYFPLDYPDAAQVSEYADEAMHWMTMHGIIQGMGNGKLAPQGTATRAQIAAMFQRFCQALDASAEQ